MNVKITLDREEINTVVLQSVKNTVRLGPEFKASVHADSLYGTITVIFTEQYVPEPAPESGHE